MAGSTVSPPQTPQQRDQKNANAEVRRASQLRAPALMTKAPWQQPYRTITDGAFEGQDIENRPITELVNALLQRDIERSFQQSLSLDHSAAPSDVTDSSVSSSVLLSPRIQTSESSVTEDGASQPISRRRRSAVTSPLPRVAGHKMFRIQLLNGVFELGRTKARLVLTAPLAAYLREIDLSAPVLQAAMDAFCYSELGIRLRCQHHYARAHAAYGIAMSMVAAEVSRPLVKVPRAHRISVAASILMLTWSVAFGGLEGPPSCTRSLVASMTHMMGGAQYMVSCTPSVVQNEADWILLHEFRHANWCVSMDHGVPNNFARQEWIDAAQQRDDAQFPPRLRYTLTLHDRLAELPELLQGLSEAISTPTEAEDLLTLYKRARDLRQQLSDWVTKQFIESDNPGFDLVDLIEMPRFATVTIGPSDLRQVYRFKSLWTAVDYHQMWRACLLLNEYRLRILECGRLELPGAKSEIVEVLWDLGYVAKRVCQTVPYSLENDLFLPNFPADACFQQAKKHMQKHDMLDELHWCYNVQEAFANGVRPDA